MLEFIPCSFTVKKLHYVLPGPAPKKTFQIYQSNAQARNLHRLPPATLQGRSPKSLQEIRETMENTRRKKLHHDEQRSLHWGGAREWVSQPVILLAIGRLGGEEACEVQQICVLQGGRAGRWPLSFQIWTEGDRNMPKTGGCQGALVGKRLPARCVLNVYTP